jgi:transcriptional activator for dhaKLM operon
MAGSYCAESIIGTCSLSLASMIGQPVKTLGDQHLNRPYSLGILLYAHF